MELLIYKASAGSGKTFTLAVEYIKLLIIDPRAYRHILAVTFTNKATTEMKERILQQLLGIWQGEESSTPYLEVLEKRLKESGHLFRSSIEPNIKAKNPKNEKKQTLTKVVKHPPALRWFSGSFTNCFARFTPCISSSLIELGVTRLPFICKRSSAVFASGIKAQHTA